MLNNCVEFVIVLLTSFLSIVNTAEDIILKNVININA